MLRIAIVAVAAAALAGAAASEEAPPAGDAAPVRTLEDRVSELKQRVQAPRERVRTDEAALGIRTVVIHRNEAGQDYWLESASYALDGEPVYVKTDLDGDLAGRTSIEVFDALARKQATPGAASPFAEITDDDIDNLFSERTRASSTTARARSTARSSITVRACAGRRRTSSTSTQRPTPTRRGR